jgi:hypothetical protein
MSPLPCALRLGPYTLYLRPYTVLLFALMVDQGALSKVVIISPVH